MYKRQAVAFAMFSALPVPQFAWNQKNMRYAICAFPLIGVVIGGLWCLCGALPLPMPAKAAGLDVYKRQVLCGPRPCSSVHHGSGQHRPESP